MKLLPLKKYYPHVSTNSLNVSSRGTSFPVGTERLVIDTCSFLPSNKEWNRISNSFPVRRLLKSIRASNKYSSKFANELLRTGCRYTTAECSGHVYLEVAKITV